MDKELKNELRRDELGEAVEEAKGFFSRPEVVKPALAVAALFLVLIGLYTAQRFRASAAESAFARATEVYHADVDAAAAGPSSTGEKYKTSTEKFQKAKGMFDDVAKSYASAPAGRRARYYSALCLVELGQYDAAETALNAIASLRDPGAIEPAMARARLGEVLLKGGRAKEAVAHYKALLGDDASGVPHDQILFGLATSLEAAGEKEAARHAYSDLVNRHPQSAYAQEARPKIEALANL